MKKDVPIDSRLEDVITRIEDLSTHSSNQATLHQLTQDLMVLAAADHIKHPAIPALVMRGMEHVHLFHADKVEALLIQTADKTAPDGRLARLLAAEWTNLRAYANLEDKAVMFPEMYAAFNTAKSVAIREAAGHGILSTCFQHALTEPRLNEIKQALIDVRSFATEHDRKGLLHATAAKLGELRKQEYELERSLR